MNAPGTLTKGTRVWVDGRAATILASDDPHAAQIAFDGAQEPEEVDLLARYAEGAVRWDAPVAAPTETPASLEQIPEKSWDEARRRERAIRPLLSGERTLARVQGIAQDVGASWRTLYRWIVAYEQDGLRGLVPDTSRRGAPGKPRLAADREALLHDAIRRLYLRRTRPTLHHAHAQIVAEFRSKKLDPPGLHTVRARLAAMDLAKRTAAREGARMARTHMVSRGQFPSGARPLQTILVDHTPLDIQLVDIEDRTRVIGRPFLTLAIDACTRMVFGYYLSLDPPSYLSVAMCLLQGVMPKDDVIKRFGLAHPWPIHGLPETVHTDNGKDFRSKHLERFAAQYEIVMEFRPVRVPHFGGLIERAIGTVNRYTHALPGTTKSSVADRGDYDAEQGALFTIEEIEEFLARRIVEHYHTAVHRELGKSPLAAWNEAVAAGTFAPTLPPDPTQFRIDLLPYEERTIQKDGLALFGLHYTDGVLQTWRSRSGAAAAEAKYVVKYDPRDLSRVYFVPPEGGATVPIPLANRALGSFSLLELRRSQALTKVEHRSWSERTLPEMLQRERSALAEAEKKSKAARRDAARIRRTKEAVASEAEKATPFTAPRDASTPSEPVAAPESVADDWGMPVLRFRGEA
ncbi:MAG: Mu transposase C-terminal domain-containing protein [Polyangiales bacterium]